MTTPILFTIPNFLTAGSGREMVNIIERLDRERYSPSVCVLRSGGGALERTLEKLDVPLIEAPFAIPLRPARTILQRAWQASRQLQPYQFTLWHSFHWSSDYSEPLIARFAGARAWLYTKKNMNWSRAWILRSLLASLIIARNTTMIANLFTVARLRKRTRLVPGGVDINRFSPLVANHLELRRQLQIPQEAPVVVCVAQLVEVKGHPTLIQAAAHVPDLHVWIVGRPVDARYSAKLHQIVNDLQLEKRVHFCDYITDVPALLAESDIFVLPTWAKWGHEEGCPVALLEAMACGKACIATDIAGSKDLIQHGVNGLLIQPEDHEQLAAQLSTLIHSPEQRLLLGQNARMIVEQDYTLEHEALRMQAVYQELLNNNRSARIGQHALR